MSLRPFTPESGRQSPFKRQNSTASSTARSTTPTSPTKPSNLSPTKPTSLSPEKTSPFARRPSQINQPAERPSSPFARPGSSLSITSSPSRQFSNGSKSDVTPPASPRAASVTPAPEEGLSSRRIASPSPFDGPAPDSPSLQTPSQSILRPTTHRTERSSSNTSTIKPPVFTTVAKTSNSTTPKMTPAVIGGGGRGGYTHVPQPLLRSMRESFEVLDSSNSGAINSASVASMLEQMGLPHTPADVREFFPPQGSGAAQLNLARYLDTLSGPMAKLSQSDELAAAFSAFDVDDSGQIDVAELRNALLNTAPEPGEQMIRLSERDVDGVLREFSARRAFGAKGTSVAKGKGDVFRWREFMGSITGGGGGAQEEVAVA